VDRTDTALLKMLGMARRPQPLAEALQSLHIVPVSISYEFDPCDALKGDELQQKQQAGTYQKDEQSDIHSIVTGMVGFKGHVHVAFGDELALSDEMDDEAIAGLVDGQVINNYLLQQTNLLALRQLQEASPESVPALTDEGRQVLAALDPEPATESTFNARLAAMPTGVQTHVRLMYANPVISRFAAVKPQ
jgi:hypothetical protein